MHAEPPGNGTGTRIMDAAEEELRRRGVKTVFVATTNDNVRALNFYQKRGFRLVRLQLEAMDRVRAAKPNVPLTGREACLFATCGSWRRCCSGVRARKYTTFSPQANLSPRT